MSITLIGEGAAYEFRWRRWALLRDAVAVHLEGGTTGALFPRLASIGDALVTTTLRLPARELVDELTAIARALTRYPLDALAMGPATAAVLYMGARVTEPRPLSPHELADIAPVGEARNLAEYFASMLDSMLHVCAHPAADGTIAVVDG